VEIQENISLRPYNTFGIDVKAKYLTSVDRVEQLENLKEKFPDERILFLGEGSNVLFLNDFDGIVVRNEIKGIQVVQQTDEYEIWDIAGGEHWHDVVELSVKQNLSGIENLALIPGKAGTAPVQNIGAYGREIKDVLISCEAFDLTNGRYRVFSNEECQFGYRDSLFKRPENKNRYFIYRIRLRLIPNGTPETGYRALQQYFTENHIDKPSIKDVFDAVVHIRRSKLPDPAEIGNAGSFFKNPVVDAGKFKALISAYPSMAYYKISDDSYKIPAAWLIDNAGWKGYREGDAGVHHKQALVLVNYGRATGRDIYRLSQKIIDDIKEKYGLELEREVQIIGRY